MMIEEAFEGLERDARATEKAATALERLATIAERLFEKLYPEKTLVRPATLTVVTNAQEKDLAETIQGSERTLDEWSDIGPRERKWEENNKK